MIDNQYFMKGKVQKRQNGGGPRPISNDAVPHQKNGMQIIFESR